jgi:hypothetical protein
LGVGVNPATELVRHALAERGDALFLDVAARCANDRDEEHRADRELENAQAVRAERGRDRVRQPLR